MLKNANPIKFESNCNKELEEICSDSKSNSD